MSDVVMMRYTRQLLREKYSGEQPRKLGSAPEPLTDYLDVRSVALSCTIVYS